MRNKNFTLAIIFASCALFTSSFTLTAQTASQRSLHPADEYTPPVPDYIMDKINEAIRLGEYIDKMEALYGVYSPSTEEIQTMRLQSFTPLLQNGNNISSDRFGVESNIATSFILNNDSVNDVRFERVGIGTDVAPNARLFIINNEAPGITYGIMSRTLAGSSGVSRIQGVHSASSNSVDRARVYGVKTTATSIGDNSFAYGLTAVATVRGYRSRAYGVRAITHSAPISPDNTATLIGVYSNVKN